MLSTIQNEKRAPRLQVQTIPLLPSKHHNLRTHQKNKVVKAFSLVTNVGDVKYTYSRHGNVTWFGLNARSMENQRFQCKQVRKWSFIARNSHSLVSRVCPPLSVFHAPTHCTFYTCMYRQEQRKSQEPLKADKAREIRRRTAHAILAVRFIDTWRDHLSVREKTPTTKPPSLSISQKEI